MANTKISELSNAGALNGTEVLPIVQGNATVKTTTQNIANLLFGVLEFFDFIYLFDAFKEIKNLFNSTC